MAFSVDDDNDDNLCFTDSQIRHQFDKLLKLKEKSHLLNLLSTDINKKNDRSAFEMSLPI